MEAIKDGRNPHPHPFGLHDPHFRPFSDPYPFHQDRLSSRTSGADRLFTEARWPTHTRPTYMNGDLRTVGKQAKMNINLYYQLNSQTVIRSGQDPNATMRSAGLPGSKEVTIHGPPPDTSHTAIILTDNTYQGEEGKARGLLGINILRNGLLNCVIITILLQIYIHLTQEARCLKV